MSVLPIVTSTIANADDDVIGRARMDLFVVPRLATSWRVDRLAYINRWRKVAFRWCIRLGRRSLRGSEVHLERFTVSLQARNLSLKFFQSEAKIVTLAAESIIVFRVTVGNLFKRFQ